MSARFALTAALIGAVLGGPVLAADLYDFVDESDGYVGIRENVVIIEGDREIKICHFNMTEAFFAAKAAGDDAAAEAEKGAVVCVPVLALAVNPTGGTVKNALDLNRFIDNSDSYVQIIPNVVMVEGEEAIEFCHFQMDEAFFTAYGAGDAAEIAARQPRVTCVPMGEAVKE